MIKVEPSFSAIRANGNQGGFSIDALFFSPPRAHDSATIMRPTSPPLSRRDRLRRHSLAAFFAQRRTANSLFPFSSPSVSLAAAFSVDFSPLPHSDLTHKDTPPFFPPQQREKNPKEFPPFTAAGNTGALFFFFFSLARLVEHFSLDFPYSFFPVRHVGVAPFFFFPRHHGLRKENFPLPPSCTGAIEDVATFPFSSWQRDEKVYFVCACFVPFPVPCRRFMLTFFFPRCGHTWAGPSRGVFFFPPEEMVAAPFFFFMRVGLKKPFIPKSSLLPPPPQAESLGFPFLP